MKEYNYNNIKEIEELIEKKRLEIREIKREIAKYSNLLDTIGNLYEYLVTPLCAISIALVALFKGPIVYILPLATTVLAVNAITAKMLIKNKIDKLNDKLEKVKKERKQAYDEREMIFEEIFIELKNSNLDIKDFYNQLVRASNDCEELTNSMKPLKITKKKLEKAKTIISKLFDYGLAPFAAIILPLLCSFIDFETVNEIILMSTSSATLLTCAILDEKLTRKIDDIDDEISLIKSDRTVNYVKRDLKLTEALEYLKSIDSSYDGIKISTQNLKNKN